MRSYYAGSDAQARRIYPLWMLPVKAFQQHVQLRQRQMNFSFAGYLLDEAPALQAFGEQALAIAVRPQYFCHVTPQPAARES